MYEKLNYNEYDDWIQKNPVEVPRDILDFIEDRKKRLDNPKLTEEEWTKLVEEHNRRMKGTSDSDLYYQLAIYRKEKKEGNIFDVEQQLRYCYCGSGKKYKRCHGK